MLQRLAYALRARAFVGRTRSQSLQARRLRSRFYEDTWKEAAAELDAPFRVLAPELFEIGHPGRRIKVSNNVTPLDDPVTLRVANDKPLAYNILRSQGLPTPRHAEFSLSNLGDAYRFLDQHRPCVIKPATGTGAGAGVTTCLQGRSHVFRAALAAAGHSARLLIEQQIEGDSLRLLFLDGELLDAVKRSPPSVTGDGQNSIAQLVQSLNLKRLAAGYQLAQTILRHDLEMKRTLAQQDLSWNSVPAKARRVVVKRVINDNTSADNESVADRLHTTLITAARRAVEAIGIRLAGIDVITADHRRGFDPSTSVILEVNGSPGYYYHYFRRGGPCRVAVPILEACLGLRGATSANSDKVTYPRFSRNVS